MFLIAGLGNPGRNYKWTRHNVGFEVIDKLSYDHNINMNKNKFKAIIGEGIIEKEKVILAKPLTYMNLSGESIRDIASFYKLENNQIIITCDDINLPIGYIRIRPKGSDGGQNGLKNIIYQLGFDTFTRIRVGIGNKPENWDLKDFVLSQFTEKENNDIINGITDAVSAIEEILKDYKNGLNNAMNKFNKKVTQK